jgi:hypothetical protein
LALSVEASSWAMVSRMATTRSSRAASPGMPAVSITVPV